MTGECLKESGIIQQGSKFVRDVGADEEVRATHVSHELRPAIHDCDDVFKVMTGREIAASPRPERFQFCREKHWRCDHSDGAAARELHESSCANCLMEPAIA